MAYNKKADENYRKKTKAFTIKYFVTDISEGKRLQAYLDSTGVSANSYLKELVKRDLDRKNILYISDVPTQHDDI